MKKLFLVLYIALSGFALVASAQDTIKTDSANFADANARIKNENVQIVIDAVAEPVMSATEQIIQNAMEQANDHALPNNPKQIATSIIGALLLCGIQWLRQRRKEKRK